MKSRKEKRIARIEGKCNRILSELLILRRQASRNSEVDAAIDRLHNATRSMRLQCEKEREQAARMFKSK